MASFLQRDSGFWQAKIRLKGRVFSQTFPTKKEAEAWAAVKESELYRNVWQDTTAAESKTFNAVVDLYIERVLPTKKGMKQDISLCNLLKSELSQITLAELSTDKLSKIRDTWSKSASPATVLKRLGLINRIMKFAQIDLGIFLPQGLPVQQIRKPFVNNARDRRLKDDELDRLLSNASTRLVPVIKWAIATAMRREEISTLTWDQINIQERYALLTETKNGTSRKVPLTNQALAILDELSDTNINGNELVFGYQSKHSISTAFDRACKRARITNLRFHDLRHEAASRLFEAGLNVIEAASVTGHKELRMLQRYTHLKPADIADKLNKVK